MYAAASWRLGDTSLRTFHSLVIKNNLLGIRPVDDMRFFGDLIIATHRLGKQVSSALTPSLPIETKLAVRRSSRVPAALLCSRATPCRARGPWGRLQLAPRHYRLDGAWAISVWLVLFSRSSCNTHIDMTLRSRPTLT